MNLDSLPSRQRNLVASISRWIRNCSSRCSSVSSGGFSRRTARRLIATRSRSSTRQPLPYACRSTNGPSFARLKQASSSICDWHLSVNRTSFRRRQPSQLQRRMTAHNSMSLSMNLASPMCLTAATSTIRHSIATARAASLSSHASRAMLAWSLWTPFEIPQNSSVSEDMIVRVGSQQKKMKHLLRMVQTEDSQGNLLFLVTNRFDLSCDEISDMYRSRWAIETFFKWMKQHLRIKHFHGQSDRAVHNQIWIALIAFCLLLLVKLETKVDHSLLQLSRWLTKLLWQPYAQWLKRMKQKPSRESKEGDEEKQPSNRQVGQLLTYVNIFT